VAHTQVYTDPGRDIVFDMDPEKEPAKLALEKGPECGWLVVEVHRLSRMPGKRSHLLGEVVIFVDEIADGGKKDGEDGEEEEGHFEEEALQNNSAYQAMIFHPVFFEGGIGEELTRRNDKMTKRFLARYNDN